MKLRLLFLVVSALAFGSAWTHACAQEADLVVTGKVVDAKSKKPLQNASVAVSNTHIGTVSNAEGLFSLTVPKSMSANSVVFSSVGYSNTEIPLSQWPAGGVVRLERAKQLEEVTVYGGDAKEIVERALDKIAKNYPLTTDMLELFYRETVQKGKRYTEISEGVLDAVKTPYRRRTIGGDRVQVLKGRKLMSQKSADTLAVKVVGGPTLAIALDFVKNPDFFLAPFEVDAYEYKMDGTAWFDDRPQYVIRFTPKKKLDYPLMKGLLYIDASRFAFTRAEFELDMSDRKLAVQTMLKKKPAGLRFNPQTLAFTIAYRQDEEGKTYLSYIQNVIKFKCDWKKRLFSSGYTAITEMVVVDREIGTESSITRKDAFRSDDKFSDEVIQYWDEDFWNGYNIIEPTESLEKAVNKLKVEKSRSAKK